MASAGGSDIALSHPSDDGKPRILNVSMVRTAWKSMQPAEKSSTDHEEVALLAAQELHLSWLDITDVDDTLEIFDKRESLRPGMHVKLDAR